MVGVKGMGWEWGSSGRGGRSQWAGDGGSKGLGVG